WYSISRPRSSFRVARCWGCRRTQCSSDQASGCPDLKSSLRTTRRSRPGTCPRAPSVPILLRVQNVLARDLGKGQRLRKRIVGREVIVAVSVCLPAQSTDRVFADRIERSVDRALEDEGAVEFRALDSSIEHQTLVPVEIGLP